jgi:predicted nucleic acid-binding protein
MNQSSDEGRKPVLLDCNAWIQLYLSEDPKLSAVIFDDQYPIIVTSYCVAEILRVLKRVSISEGIDLHETESLLWECLYHPNVQKEFTTEISESILKEVRRAPEYHVIAKLLDLEVKDVPYIVSAFHLKAKLVTNDERSLLNRRDLIKKELDVEIASIQEFLAEN